MSKISLEKGRVNQKLQTRNVILESAKSLSRQKKKLNLEDIAENAGVSRATIYRYYPNIELLMIEASLDIHFLSPEELLSKFETLSFQDQIRHVQEYYNSLAQKHEIPFRRYLSAVLKESLISKKKMRGARRIECMNLVLKSAPKDLKNPDRKNLKNIASILMGIDALVATKDVCGLNNKQSDELLNWAMDMILKGLDIDDAS